MSSILKVDPKVTRLVNYIKDIAVGKIQTPSFQRDFVWGKKEKLELFESLKLGYPIGSLLFWKPKETFKVKDVIGPYRVPAQEASEHYYILDGFQRLTTLFGCLINPNTTNLELIEPELKRDFTIYYDLENEEFVFPRLSSVDITLIPVNTLIDTYAFLDYSELLRNKISDVRKSTMLIDRARVLSSAILDYQLPSVEIIGGTIEDAVDIFSRLNSKGSRISTDWMVSALTYNEQEAFRLGTVIDELLADLRNYNFEKLKRETILQCIQSSFGKVYFDEKIEELVKKPDFIKVTIKTVASIVKAVKFLFEQLLVVDYKLLPYNSQLIFITYFFNEIERPSDSELEKLKDWFWVTTYSNYFTIYSLSKQRHAFIHFKNFVSGSEAYPVYNDSPAFKFTTTEFPRNINFGSVRAKALVLYLLNKANNFCPVNAEEVDEVKIIYLSSEITSPEGVVPYISYLPNFSRKSAFQQKHKDLNFLLSSPEMTKEYARFLLDESVEFAYFIGGITEAHNIRKKKIRDEERLFVESLGLEYI